MKRRLMALVAVIALVIAACGGEEGGDTTEAAADTTEAAADTTEAAADTTAAGATTTAAAGGDCIVGMSWNNYNEERWAKHDEPAIVAALEAGGCEYIQSDAGSSEEQQITDVENLIAQGATVVMILAQNTQAILPTVQAATDQGIPVIAYDRLIEDANTFYVSFDNVLVGQLMAEVIFEQVPTGNYFIVKGNGSDANSDFLREGIGSVIDAAAEAGDITILEEDYTDNWDPALAQTTVEQWLSRTTTTCRPSSPRTTEWRLAPPPPWMLRVCSARLRCRVKTPTSPPSTGWRWERRRCRCGRMPARWAPRPEKLPCSLPVGRRSPTSRGLVSSSTRTRNREQKRF